MEFLDLYIIPYLPTILTAIMSGLTAWLLKKLGNDKDTLNSFKSDIKRDVKQIISEDESLQKKVIELEKLCKENEESYKEQISILKSTTAGIEELLVNTEKRYIELEALIREDDSNE